MKATYDPAAKTKFTTSHRKDDSKCHFESYAVIDFDKPKQFLDHVPLFPSVELRLYGTGNTCFACLWVRLPDGRTQGSGKAGGYGYHRPSAAAQEAITNAGFTLSEDIHGVGESAIREALCAIATSIGLTNFGVVHSHP